MVTITVWAYSVFIFMHSPIFRDTGVSRDYAVARGVTNLGTSQFVILPLMHSSVNENLSVI